MSLSCEQLFYGRGERGYGILGESPGAAPFRKHVEVLCGTVGMPSADYGGEAFLMSVPEGDSVIMVCGRRGTPDSMGRETLFFHALVAEKRALAAAGADAFSLFEKGAFAATFPHGEMEAVQINIDHARDDSMSHPLDGCAPDATFPCFIRSNKPASDAVRVLIGDRTNDLAWATFAFQPLDGFDIQVIPQRGTAPQGASELDARGKLVRAAKKATSSPSISTDAQCEARQDVAPPFSTNQNPSAMLKVSILANFALVAACVASFWARRDTSPSPIDVAPQQKDPIVITNIVDRYVTNTVERVISQSKEEKAEFVRQYVVQYLAFEKVSEKDCIKALEDAISFLSERKPDSNTRPIMCIKGFLEQLINEQK